MSRRQISDLGGFGNSKLIEKLAFSKLWEQCLVKGLISDKPLKDSHSLQIMNTEKTLDFSSNV